VEGVTTTLVVFAIVLIVLAVVFIRSNMDGYDVDDDDYGGEDRVGYATMENTLVDDGWDAGDVFASKGSDMTLFSRDDDIDNDDPRPGFDLVFEDDELGPLGANSIFDDSFSDSGSIN